MATTIKLTVNGKAVALKVDDPSMPLLYALRDQLGLHGMHFGCGLAQCGACTVHYYGEALRSCVMPVSAVSALPHDVIEESERRWAYVVAAVIGFVFAGIIFSSVHFTAQPPSNVETIDASRLHLAGEFVEENLGTAVQPDGSVIVRVIAQQYSFVPSCIVVPANPPVVFRVTSPDVVHGFLITDTNVNSMVVPGFIAEVRTRFEKPKDHLMPCHEYCSVGHDGMWAHVKVVDRQGRGAILTLRKS